MNRTTLDFTAASDVWQVVDDWANEEKWTIKESNGSQRLYQKGRGFLVAPMMLAIHNVDGRVKLESWVRANFYTRMSAFFLIPAEMGIESGGFKMSAPRKIARKSVNILLGKLGQSLIP